MPRAATLKLVDHTKNRLRLYRMTVCTTLFGETCLRIEWGRLGRRLRARSEFFPTPLELEQRFSELLELRHRHGYVQAEA
jgi:predicted DNA-binding WGR domain protein